MKDPKFARFYLQPKIGRPMSQVASNIQWWFLYPKDTNGFLKKLRSGPKLPENINLSIMDSVGLYSRWESVCIEKTTQKPKGKMEEYVSTDTIIHLVEVVFRNNMLNWLICWSYK